MAVREDFRQKLTKAFIESIEETDGLPWEHGWKDVVTRPFNPSTGKKYRGGNIFSLMLKAIEQGSDDPRWMTLKQANDAGIRIRKVV